MTENTVPSTAETVSETPVQNKIRRYGKIAALAGGALTVAAFVAWAVRVPKDEPAAEIEDDSPAE